MTLLAGDAGPNVELIGVGGTLRTLTRSFVGAGATRTVNEHYADRLFLSVKGVVDDDTLTDADSSEADVKRTMIAHAREAVLLIDGSKLAERGLTAIAPLSQIAIVLAADISPKQAGGARAHRHHSADRPRHRAGPPAAPCRAPTRWRAFSERCAGTLGRPLDASAAPLLRRVCDIPGVAEGGDRVGGSARSLACAAA